MARKANRDTSYGGWEGFSPANPMAINQMTQDEPSNLLGSGITPCHPRRCSRLRGSRRIVGGEQIGGASAECEKKQPMASRRGHRLPLKRVLCQRVALLAGTRREDSRLVRGGGFRYPCPASSVVKASPSHGHAQEHVARGFRSHEVNDGLQSDRILITLHAGAEAAGPGRNRGSGRWRSRSSRRATHEARPLCQFNPLLSAPGVAGEVGDLRSSVLPANGRAGDLR